MSCFSVIDDSLIDVRSFQFVEMIKLFVLSESEWDIPVFIEGRHGAKSNKYFAQHESHPDLIISPMIANLQTPLKIDIESIYIEYAA